MTQKRVEVSVSGSVTGSVCESGSEIVEQRERETDRHKEIEIKRERDWDNYGEKE